ncbi:MAG: phosphoribosylglycinamide formyltransferase [Candidatus Omnitrophota bacterium]|jgi:phosphoribosylglycinamide formyltransferase-1
MNIAVFVSGNGSNLQALIDAEARGELATGKITLIVCDQPEAFALKRAEKAEIKTFVLEAAGVASREEYDKKVAKELEKENIELIVLAGFMRILSGDFVDKYQGRIMNIHPALLPSFKGTHGIRDAVEYGVKVTGVTVHFVDQGLDSGPVILQKCVPIEKEDTMDTLEEKIHSEEHKMYPEAVRLFTENRLRINGRRVDILDK